MISSSDSKWPKDREDVLFDLRTPEKVEIERMNLAGKTFATNEALWGGEDSRPQLTFYDKAKPVIFTPSVEHLSKFKLLMYASAFQKELPEDLDQN